MEKFQTAVDAAMNLRPDEPVYCFRPQVLAADARQFMGLFPGKTAYAVKTNGEDMVIRTLLDAGVTAFDVASPSEIEAVRRQSATAELLYMHPVKAQSAIRFALETHGIRTTVVDHEDEITKLHKIVQGLDIDPGSLTVFVRIQTKGSAAYELSKKFGASPSQAVELLQRLARNGYRLGICFHVGSQIQDPDTYDRALASADWVRNRAGVHIAELDVGGGPKLMAAMARVILFTRPVNYLGLPALTIPYPHDGVPNGFQLIGRPFAESVLLRLAAAYQKDVKPEIAKVA